MIPSWHPPLCHGAAVTWLFLSSAQDAECFKLANTSELCAKLHSPAHWRSLNCLHTSCSGDPQLFTEINNWGMWSGHGTKVCSLPCGRRQRKVKQQEQWHTHSCMLEISELSFLPLQLSLTLGATSPPPCLHSTTPLSPCQRSGLLLPPGTQHK